MTIPYERVKVRPEHRGRRISMTASAEGWAKLWLRDKDLLPAPVEEKE